MREKRLGQRRGAAPVSREGSKSFMRNQDAAVIVINKPAVFDDHAPPILADGGQA
jgi:hypothetical protein